MYRNLFRSAQVLGVACLIAAMLPGCLCVPGVNAVYFADSQLEAAVRGAVHKPFGCINQIDLAALRTLDAHGLGISSLDGLENCTNLTELDLSGNNIRSIGALTNLTNLVTLDLHNNNIVRIDALAGLFLLRNVDVSGADNDIRDFGPLTANALNAGIGDGAVVTVSKEWTVDSQGNFFADFQDDYNALTSAGVTVIIADTTSGGTAK